ncbi:hypothetical protein DEALK_09320 [Dehalogenimonas alkenigignens]|uniref:Uncharacterized protein n=1 Tax=Dehalogenimonas alkenigignens TaxID=1217799 RepID=A0A0W0GHP8_9CHLR|nr:DUF6512 family protein [Dehalogenimonas alkenigignens]KTB48087.1 hypothetical protein DEALK_09320 [Dehalogenimonas alkenigignens]
MKRILRWELLGILFVFSLGALLHFVFEWSGESLLAGAFASVNESVWEHFKQGFWPMVIWAAIEYPVFRGKVNNFFAAKGTAVYLIPAVTALIFYAYTAATGEEILIVDILIFAAAVAIGQLVSYKILTSGKLPGYMNWVGLAMIIALGSAMILFTFNPPELPIFLDPNGFYGIPFGAR